MEDHSVVTKAELKNIQLITKLEDTVEALTDSKKQVDKENAKLTEHNDQLKKDYLKLSETNKALTLQGVNPFQLGVISFQVRMNPLQHEVNLLQLEVLSFLFGVNLFQLKMNPLQYEVNPFRNEMISFRVKIRLGMLKFGAFFRTYP